MNEVARQVVLLSVVVVTLVAYFVALAALFPQRLARAHFVADSAPGRSFLAGSVNFLLFGGIALALLGIADRLPEGLLKAVLTIPALAIALLLGVGLSVGLGAVALLLRRRLARSQPGPEAGDWKGTAGAALVLTLACLTPFVGWFILLPYAGLLGLGAFILGFFWREPSAASDG